MTYCACLFSAALAYLPALGGQTATDKAEPPKPNPYRQALSRAATEHTYLLLAIFGDDCEGCRVYETTVFKDAGVAEWIAKRAVLVTVLADDLAGHLPDEIRKVEGPPTILILSSDGRELGRQVGVATPARFLAKLRATIQSDRIIGGELYKPWAGQDVVLEAIRRAGRLTAGGDFEESLSDYVWCLDHRVTHSPLFPSQHLPGLIEGLARLAGQHEPARMELLNRIEAASNSVLTSVRADTYSLYVVKHGNAALDREDETVNLFRKLKERRAGDLVIDLFVKLNFEALFNAGMYEDLRYAVDDPEHVDIYLNEVRNTQRPLHEARKLLAARYEILLALGKTSQARDVAFKLVSFDSSPKAELALAEAALRSGKPGPENVRHARTAYIRLRSGAPHNAIVLAKLLAWVEPDSQESYRLLSAARRRAKTPEQEGLIDKAIADVQDIRTKRIRERSNPPLLREN